MSSRQSRQNNYDETEDFIQGKEELQKERPQKELKKRDKERVQFDFSSESLERLDEMKERIGASTRAEVIRQALRILEWFVTETEPDDTIIITDTNDKLVTKFKAKLLHD